MAQFVTKPEDMPRISTSADKPNYTSLKKFQEHLDDNALTITSNTTELGHLALTISSADFVKANDTKAFKVPTSPGTAPTQPNRITRSGTTYPTDPFLAQQTQRLFLD